MEKFESVVKESKDHNGYCLSFENESLPFDSFATKSIHWKLYPNISIRNTNVLSNPSFDKLMKRSYCLSLLPKKQNHIPLETTIDSR